MASTRLTDFALQAAIKSMRSGKSDHPYIELSDVGRDGLTARIGKRRTSFHVRAKRTRHKIGPYPGMKLAEARAAARKKRVALDEGRDPGAEARGEEGAVDSDVVAKDDAVTTFARQARKYLDAHQGKERHDRCCFHLLI